MSHQALLTTAEDILALREQHRAEMNCQIVHDSIHRRSGWTLTYRLERNGTIAGFGAIAISGPWKDRPTIFEFYVLPEHRAHGFALFEALITASNAQFMEVQSNDTLLAVMLHTYARDIFSEKIVFHDKIATDLPAMGATLQCTISPAEIKEHMEHRQGGPEWHIDLNGQTIGQGGILFHYNRPYGDIYMDVAEPFRRRGFGSWLVQELKRAAYQLGAIPCARCSPENLASRNTLQKAGFVPFAHILCGQLRTSQQLG